MEGELMCQMLSCSSPIKTHEIPIFISFVYILGVVVFTFQRSFVWVYKLMLTPEVIEVPKEEIQEKWRGGKKTRDSNVNCCLTSPHERKRRINDRPTTASDFY